MYAEWTTEFCLGSHILDKMSTMDFVETPRVAGTLFILFGIPSSYRGLGNSKEACRSSFLLHACAAAADGKEFRDSVNFFSSERDTQN
jgi:hypothetical protein